MSYGWPGPAPIGSTVTGPLAAPIVVVKVSVVAVTPFGAIVKTPERPPPKMICWPATKPSAMNEPPSVRVRTVPALVAVPLKLGPVSVIASPPMRTSATVPAAGPPAAIGPPERKSVFPSALIESIIRGPLLTPLIQTSCPAAKPAAVNEPVAAATELVVRVSAPRSW